MPPRRSEFDAYEDDIRQWVANGVPYDEIRVYLYERTGRVVPSRTFKRRLEEWNISSYTKVPDNPDLRARIAFYFAALRLSDADTVELLETEGYKISERGLAKVRKAMGLLKRHQSANFEELDVLLRGLLKKELDDQTITGFGEGNVYTFMRSKYSVVGKYVLKLCLPRFAYHAFLTALTEIVCTVSSASSILTAMRDAKRELSNIVEQ